MSRIKSVLGVALGAVMLLADPAQAQGHFPSRPIRVIVPYPAGGIVDMVARAVTEQVGRDWKQTVVIEANPTATRGWSPDRRRWSIPRSTRTPVGTR